jgi:gluconate 2-dehydrogenase gamma chain
MAERPDRPRPSRRDFVSILGISASAAALSSIWPDALARAADGQQATPHRTLTAQQADDFGAIADRIMPPDDAAPGARDLGVVIFADRFFASFAPEKKPAFDKALAAANTVARHHAPDAKSFARLTARQQDAALKALESTDFDNFDVLRTITLSGYFSHPSHGGNKDFAAWKMIGFEDRMEWTPPFGYYDRPEVMAQLVPKKLS